MKHLKKYKLFEAESSPRFSNLKRELEDIVLELSDDGFGIDIDETNYTPPMFSDSIRSVCVGIYRKNDEIWRWDDIKDAVKRIEDYVWRADEGYGVDVEVTKEQDWMSLDRFIDVYGGEEFSYPGISLLIYSEDDYGDLLNSMDESLNESNEERYSIFQFSNDLHYHSENKLDKSEIKKWTNHFIGDDWYDIIDEYLTKAWEAMKKVDIDNINDRLYDIWDELPTGKDKWVTTAIIYGDYDKINEPVKRKYNGSMPIRDLDDEERYNMIMKSIIRDILIPTFKIGGYKQEVYIRQTDAEEFVTDKKFQCVNFDIMNYEVVRNSDIIVKKKYELQKLRNYANVLTMFVPCVYIDIGMGRDTHRTGTINLKKLESGFDDVLPTILPTLDHSDVIFDMSREDRQFDDDRDIYDYSVKILLKFY
jgi:hypothetical protein